MNRIVLATRNKNKIEEIRAILSDLHLETLTLNEFPEIPLLKEEGSTMRDNSLQKAQTVYDHTHVPTLADDSGLEVFYLNGKPGVRSARYAGDDATDDENNEKLLGEMRGVPPRRRRAQFKAVLTIVGQSYRETTEGICEGILAESPRGSNGFGYDPIFVPNGFSRTYAELTAGEKNTISHRSRALASMKEILRHR